MAVINVQPDGYIHNMGTINSTMHVYNTNHPAGAVTHYDITIINIQNWNNVPIAPGHTDTYSPSGNAVYTRNNGPSVLQVLYADQELTPEEAGWSIVPEMPED